MKYNRIFKPHELEFITDSERDMNFTPNPYKPMSEREKEILDAAIYDSYINANNRGINPFTAGAKWADEHPATTKELKDYTTEELKAELKRRQLEARRRLKHMKLI